MECIFLCVLHFPRVSAFHGRAEITRADHSGRFRFELSFAETRESCDLPLRGRQIVKFRANNDQPDRSPIGGRGGINYKRVRCVSRGRETASLCSRSSRRGGSSLFFPPGKTLYRGREGREEDILTKLLFAVDKNISHTRDPTYPIRPVFTTHPVFPVFAQTRTRAQIRVLANGRGLVIKGIH